MIKNDQYIMGRGWKNSVVANKVDSEMNERQRTNSL